MKELIMGAIQKSFLESYYLIQGTNWGCSGKNPYVT